ncbi:hypothetical protein [Hymenobacter persicinus]|uniref:Uncharacterized protein n=1 Tax=Hymenobacter persicinus TaxID=2025506 RepID=A0A4Q5LCT1_9BACT|nr:hypothetical protein [Hymenobacter persicinus]RYU81020.1 hypothetical protein EWM57_07195 [Hymenobacter persicinus]
MKRLIDALADDADFFVEQIQLTAIVFDNTDDVTVWATTFLDESLHFFHLGLQFPSLDLLLRLAGPRAEALQEEVAEALATVTEWPCLLEYTSEEKPPVPLAGVAMKLSCTYPAEDFENDEEEEGEELDLGLDEGDDEEEEDYEGSTPHNIFYLEGVFLRLEP